MPPLQATIRTGVRASCASRRTSAASASGRGDNETFIVPVDERLPPPRGMVPTQKDVFKLEVFDYDWLGRHDLLGQIEMSRAKLQKLAVIADEQVRHGQYAVCSSMYGETSERRRRV